MNYKYAGLHNFSARIITGAMFVADSVWGNLFQVAERNNSAADQSKDTKSCVDTLSNSNNVFIATLNGRFDKKLGTWLIMLHFRFARLGAFIGSKICVNQINRLAPRFWLQSDSSNTSPENL